jgi:hypothetical protein
MSEPIGVVPYVFVIDTDSYAGNFERELCAYVTGAQEEDGCSHGEKEAELFREEEPKEVQGIIAETIAQGFVEHDGRGYLSPYVLVHTPGTEERGGEYNSVGIFFEAKPNGCLVHILKKRAKKYGEIHKNILGEPKPFKVTGFRLIEQELVQTESEI